MRIEYRYENSLPKRLPLYLHREGDDLKAFPKIQSHSIRLTLYKLLSSSTFALRETLDLYRSRTYNNDFGGSIREFVDLGAEYNATYRLLDEGCIHRLG